MRLEPHSESGCPCWIRLSHSQSWRIEKIGSKLTGPVYLDASGLAKIYLPEAESEQVETVLRGRTDLLVSDLAVTEVISAAARRRREGILPKAAAQALRKAILKDLDSQMYRLTELLRETFREAERILLALDVSLRTADALHLAVALTAEAKTIVTFDRRLSSAAFFLSLEVWPQTTTT